MDKRVFSIVEFGRYRGWPLLGAEAPCVFVRLLGNWPAAVGLVSQPTAARRPDEDITFNIPALSQAAKQLKNRDALSSLP